MRAAAGLLLLGWGPLLVYLPFDAARGGGGNALGLGLWLMLATGLAAGLLAIQGVRSLLRPSVRVIDVARGHVRVRVGRRAATLQGEAFLPGHGSPDFELLPASFRHWDAPHDTEVLGDAERERVVAGAAAALRARGMAVVVTRPPG